MNAFREKALWENDQRLICQKDILQRQLAEVKKTKKIGFFAIFFLTRGYF